MYLYKNGQLPESFKNMSFIPEIEIFFVCPLVEQMYENSPYDSKDPEFLIQ